MRIYRTRLLYSLKCIDVSKKDGYDCVAARRISRKGEPKIRSFFAHMFYKLMNGISDVKLVEGARDFRLMSRKMVNAIVDMGEYNRFSKGIFQWVGFDTKWLEYENIERVAGKTKWSFVGLFMYSLEGIMAFSTRPLAIASIIGLFFCLLSIVMIGIIILKTFLWGDPVKGYPSLVCVIMFIGGIQLFCLGLVGQYIAKMYMETKQRPVYIIKETEQG